MRPKGASINDVYRFIHKVTKELSAIHRPYKRHKLFEFWRQISFLSLHYCGLIFVLIALLLSKSASELSVTVCLLLFRKPLVSIIFEQTIDRQMSVYFP